ARGGNERLRRPDRKANRQPGLLAKRRHRQRRGNLNQHRKRQRTSKKSKLRAGSKGKSKSSPRKVLKRRRPLRATDEPSAASDHGASLWTRVGRAEIRSEQVFLATWRLCVRPVFICVHPCSSVAKTL